MSLLLDTNVVSELRKGSRANPHGDHAERILPVDYRVAEQWGRLTAMRSGSVIDTLRAATAQAFDLVLVTRNVKHVAWTGVSCLKPFDPAAAD